MVDFIGSSLILNVLVIVISFLVLDWSSNLTIKNALKISTVTQLGKTAIGFSLIAFSTSLPELTVAITAALSGGAELSVGNVIGSNIVNICVVIGLAALIVYFVSLKKRKIPPHVKADNIVPSFAKSELSSIDFGLLISSIIPVILIFISAAAWIVGLALIGIFILYMHQLSKVRMPPENGDRVTQEEKRKLKRYLVFTLIGVLGVVLSAYFLVESAISIAQSVGLSQQIIGATIVAIGTSLPELSLDLKAFLQGHPGLAFGDIIGSSFVNITLILGITLFVPFLMGSPVSLNTNVFLTIVGFSVITNMILWYFLKREKIGKKEGVLFLIIYILFILITTGII